MHTKDTYCCITIIVCTQCMPWITGKQDADSLKLGISYLSKNNLD